MEEQERTGIIYKATNPTNGMSYIGKTINSLHKRKKEHIRSELNSAFHTALKTIEFEWTIVEENISIKDIPDRERFWVSHFDTVFPSGYNMTHGGNTNCHSIYRNLGYTMSFFRWLHGKINESGPVGVLARRATKPNMKRDRHTPTHTVVMREWIWFYEHTDKNTVFSDYVRIAFSQYETDLGIVYRQTERIS